MNVLRGLFERHKPKNTDDLDSLNKHIRYREALTRIHSRQQEQADLELPTLPEYDVTIQEETVVIHAAHRFTQAQIAARDVIRFSRDETDGA